MREMKDSGIEWIGELPIGWETRKIKHVATLNGRIGWQGLTSSEYCDDGAYLITGIDFDNGQIDWSTCVHVPMERWAEAPQIQIQNGDLLITKDGTVGKVAIVSNMPSETSLNSGVLLIRTADSCYKKYLFWILQSEIFWKWFSTINAGNSTIIHLYQYDFCNFSFPFPEYGLQCNIANYLDQKCSQIDAIIARQQEVIEKLKAYKLSVITEAVTKGLNPNMSMKDSGVEWIGEIPDFWNVVPLKTCSDILPGYAFSSDDFDTENGTALLRGINVTPNGVRWEDVVYWNKPITEQLRAFELVAGDIVVGLDRPWVSGGTRVCWVTQKDLPALLLQRVCRIRAKENIDSRWIYHWIASKSFQEALSIETTGVSVPHISTKQIGQFNITLPPIEVQRQICDILEAKHYSIDKMVSKKQAIIDKLTEYKKSLIYEVVTGNKEV